MIILKKSMEPTKKKKYILFFKNKIETDVQNKFFFFCGTHEFYFTNMKTVLQIYVPNKPMVSKFS